MNYKQITLSIITFILAIYIPLVTAYAQEASSPSAHSSSGLTVANDYQLPYPGLLPDNPLYPLKALRDRLTAFFLSKPLDKANFDLLQSDKNVEASYLLVIQQRKGSLALTTFSQAQDDFEAALTQATAAKKQGYSIMEISKKLELSHQKHVQMLHAVAQQAGQENSQTVQQMRNREGEFTKTLSALR